LVQLDDQLVLRGADEEPAIDVFVEHERGGRLTSVITTSPVRTFAVHTVAVTPETSVNVRRPKEFVGVRIRTIVAANRPSQRPGRWNVQRATQRRRRECYDSTVSERNPMLQRIAAVLFVLASAVPASAQVDARMFRQPAVSADKIAFV